MAERALGTKLQIGKTSPVTVAGLTSIGGLDVSADTMDVTTLDSEGWREYLQGLKDGGEVPLEGYLELKAGKGQKELYDLLDSGEAEDFTILFPKNMGSWQFKGVVTAFSTSADLEDPLAFSATIKVSGKPTLTVGAGT